MAFKNDLESNKELERIVDNFFTIKNIEKRKFEIESYSRKLTETVFFALKNHKYGIINSFIYLFF